MIYLMILHRYYHNITSNTLVVLEAMAAHGVNTLIYSSTCATYGEPETMPITEQTPQVKLNKVLVHFQLKMLICLFVSQAFGSEYLRSLRKLQNWKFSICLMFLFY